jgi:hypothetical protein
MKKFLIAGTAALLLVLPGTTALAASDDLSSDIQLGLADTASNAVQDQVGTAQDEQAGEVGQNGEIDQVGEVDQVGDTGDPTGSNGDSAGVPGVDMPSDSSDTTVGVAGGMGAGN